MIPGTQEVNSFVDMDFGNIEFPLITVYYNPTDYPHKYVARLFEINHPLPYIIIRDNLTDIRKEIPDYMVRLDRQEDDDAVIVEVWL